MISETAIEMRARRAARRVGLLARKSRSQETIDNRGGFMLVDPNHNRIIGGERFDLTAEAVIDFCTIDNETRQPRFAH